ncbi:MAG: phosphopantothenoylcysteine decarboxylase domain-containing protein [Anaplasma sp.]
MVSVLITAGSTREYIDHVRYISSGSSGKQGYALAECMGKAGWDVKLVSCPVQIEPKLNLYRVFPVETSAQMLRTCLDLLPVDVAIFIAAVTDWIPYRHNGKLKKSSINTISMMHSPDIARCIGTAEKRPKLVIGCCLESTENLIESARQKLMYKHCDWVIANEYYVKGKEPTMGSDYNKISIVTKDSVKSFPVMTKLEVAAVLTENIVDYFNGFHLP